MKIGIFYFSGSGNTKYVAELFQKELILKGAAADLFSIDEVMRYDNMPETDVYELLGFGFTVHAFNAPEIVFRFIRKFLPNGEKKAFLFKCPGDPLFNGGSSFFMKRALAKKGIEVFHESIIAMPANVVVRYEESFIKQLLNAAAKRAARAAGEITAGKERLIKEGIFLSFIAGIFSRCETFGARYWGKKLKVKPGCIMCRKCFLNCPAGNIYRKVDSVRFRDKCILCMRCIYGCPVKVIYPGLFKFSVIKDFNTKGWFDYDKILKDPDIKDDFVTRKTTGFLRHFYKYFQQS